MKDPWGRRSCRAPGNPGSSLWWLLEEYSEGSPFPHLRCFCRGLGIRVSVWRPDAGCRSEAGQPLLCSALAEGCCNPEESACAELTPTPANRKSQITLNASSLLSPHALLTPVQRCRTRGKKPPALNLPERGKFSAPNPAWRISTWFELKPS